MTMENLKSGLALSCGVGAAGQFEFNLEVYNSRDPVLNGGCLQDDSWLKNEVLQQQQQ